MPYCQQAKEHIYSVIEVSMALKNLIESELPVVKVYGEISGYKLATSGHLYFNLKDSEALLNVVCWRSTAINIPFNLSDGLAVICTGKLTTYPGRSSYQLILSKVELAGEGALLAMIEKRKQQFLAEGLFAAEHKKPLPFMPKVLGIVTSLKGAALQDILHRVKERFPLRLLIWDVAVQGKDAAAQIAAAIKGFNSLPATPDILIVARGGGSVEDLLAFNEEIVVRAVYDSAIPVISAVGHETDFTLIDYVADFRAPTPTAAIEMATPVLRDLEKLVETLDQRLKLAIQNYLNSKGRFVARYQRALTMATRYLIKALDGKVKPYSSKIGYIGKELIRDRHQTLYSKSVAIRLLNPHPHIYAKRTQLNQLLLGLQKNIHKFIGTHRQDLAVKERILQSYNYYATLARGFAILETQDGETVSSLLTLRAKQQIRVKAKDGELTAIIQQITQY